MQKCDAILMHAEKAGKYLSKVCSNYFISLKKMTQNPKVLVYAVMSV